jgi:CubicO group peptidase (beta-lactamase class C family)
MPSTEKRTTTRRRALLSLPMLAAAPLASKASAALMPASPSLRPDEAAVLARILYPAPGVVLDPLIRLAVTYGAAYGVARAELGLPEDAPLLGEYEERAQEILVSRYRFDRAKLRSGQ